MVLLVLVVALALIVGTFFTLPGRERWTFLVTLLVAIGAHVAVAIGLFLLPLLSIWPEPEPNAVELVTLEPDVREPEPEPEDVEAEPEPEPELPEPEPPPEPVEARPDPRPQPEPPPDAPPPEEPPAAEEAIADFTGETLTNEDGPSWASAAGSGDAMEGPIGQPGAAVTGRRRAGVRGGVVGGAGEEDPGPTIVPMSDLSRPPGVPDPGRLQETLRRNYPRQARELGVEGTARVRIRVRSDGRVVPMAVLNESYEGFGDACRRTLREGGRFTPPLDRRGEPVDTITAFTCTFRIRF